MSRTPPVRRSGSCGRVAAIRTPGAGRATPANRRCAHPGQPWRRLGARLASIRVDRGTADQEPAHARPHASPRTISSSSRASSGAPRARWSPSIGLPLELRLAPEHLVLLPLAALIFLAFYVLVFSRLVRKHTGRIRATTEDRLPFWQFFNGPSWAAMAIMMLGGMGLRLGHVMPDWMIAFFYTGLGIALFLCGVRFLGAFARKDVLVPAPGD